MYPVDDGSWRKQTGNLKINQILNGEVQLDTLELKQLKKTRYIVINCNQKPKNQDGHKMDEDN